jgi:hypothetical protein
MQFLLALPRALARGRGGAAPLSSGYAFRGIDGAASALQWRRGASGGSAGADKAGGDFAGALGSGSRDRDERDPLAPGGSKASANRAAFTRSVLTQNINGMLMTLHVSAGRPGGGSTTRTLMPCAWAPCTRVHLPYACTSPRLHLCTHAQARRPTRSTCSS